jgi:hypothetical protein
MLSSGHKVSYYFMVMSRVNSFFELSQGLLEQQYEVRFNAQGNSMKPFILPGTGLVISAFKPHQAVRGDIILYRVCDDQLAAHRVLRITNDMPPVYHMIADNETMGGNAIQADQILGFVRRDQGSWSALDRMAGLIWYRLRPLRRVKKRFQAWLISLAR